MFNNKKSQNLGYFIILSFFFLVYSNPKINYNNKEDDIIPIKLKHTIEQQIFEFNETKASKLFYVCGEIDDNKKYLLVEIYIKNHNINQINEITYIFITKKQDFNYTIDEYDYVWLENSLVSKKITVPQKYFYLEKTNGFYLNITFPFLYESSNNIHFIFQYVNEVTLNIGEKFSFYSKYESIEYFDINVNISNYLKRNNSEYITFILNGGDEKQLSMKIDSRKAIKVLPNVYAYWVYNYSSENEIIPILIKIDKNINFVFQSHIYNLDKDEIQEEEREVRGTIYENEFNEFFMVKGPKRQCFDLIMYNNKQIQDTNIRELRVIGKYNFNIDIFSNENEILNSFICKKEKNNDYEYVVSNNINISETMKKICIRTFHEDISFIKIDLNKRNMDGDTSGIMIEPLLSEITYNFIIKTKRTSSSDSKINNIHIHSQSQYFYNVQGLKIEIKKIYGDIRVYKDICSTYPSCSITKEILKEKIKSESPNSIFQTIEAEGNFFSSVLESSLYLNHINNKQSIIIIDCNDGQDLGYCEYRITYYDTNKEKNLYNNSIFTKYLGPFKKELKNQDNYAFIFNEDKTIIINLSVHFGNSHILPITDIKGCSYKEQYIGPDEKWTISCNSDIDYEEPIRYIFQVRAGDSGSVYSLFITEKENNESKEKKFKYPFEFPLLFPIKKGELKKIEISSNFKDKSNEEKIITIINPINCNINFENINKEKNFFNIAHNIFQYKYESQKENLNFSFTQNDHKYCLIYINSFNYPNSDSSFILSESKPFRFKLNNYLKEIRANYPFSIMNNNTSIYLKINLLVKVTIKITIQIGHQSPIDYFISNSIKICIIDQNNIGLKFNTLSIINIKIGLYKNNTEADIELKIAKNSNSNSPFLIKNDEQNSDLIFNDNIKYYMSIIDKKSRVNINLNFNYGSGYIYGRIINSEDIKEKGGWNNYFFLPEEKTEIRNLLPYDFDHQSLIVTEENTEKCDDFCFLIFGVKSSRTFGNEKENSNFPLDFNVVLRNSDSEKNKYYFTDIHENELLSSLLFNGKNEYYKFIVQEKFIQKIILYFQSDFCFVTLSFNNQFFNDTNNIKYIENRALNDLEILNISSLNLTKDSIIYIKISLKSKNILIYNNTKKVELKYKIRISTFNNKNNFMIVDTSYPTPCSNIKMNYCDYFINLDSYDRISDIKIGAFSSEVLEEKIAIFGNVLSFDDLQKYVIDDGKSLIFPDDKNYDFPNDKNIITNFLKLKSSDIIDKKINISSPFFILIRVYSQDISKIELITSLTTFQPRQLTTPEHPQLILVESNNRLNINIRSPFTYYFKLLYGQGKLEYLNESHTLNRKNNIFSMNSIQNNTSSNIVLISTFSSNSIDEKIEIKSNYFLCLFWYEKEKYDSIFTKIIPYSTNIFSYYNYNYDFSLNYYIPINNVIQDLPININFEELSSFEHEYDNIIKNSTDMFTIKGYLITEENLISLKGEDSSTLFKLEQIIGHYELPHHHGYILFNKENINRFKAMEENKEKHNLFAYISIKKSSISERKYYYIKGKINVFLPNETNIEIPPDNYFFGIIKPPVKGLKLNSKEGHLISHIYKLGKIPNFKNKNKKIKIEFSSEINNISVKIIESLNSIGKETDYFGIEKEQISDNTFGKNILILTKNLHINSFLLIQGQSCYEENEYIFKYSIIDSEINYRNICYNNSLIFNPIKQTVMTINITISKVMPVLKNQSTVQRCKCNYYLRIYEKEYSFNTRKNSISFKKKFPYSIYAISNNNPILNEISENNQFSLLINIETRNDFYIDVIAELLPEKELFSYSKIYPLKSQKKEENDESNRNNDNKGPNIFYIILLIFCTFFIAGIIVLIFCLCCKQQKTKTDSLTELKNFYIDKSDDDDGNFGGSSSSDL